MAFERHDPGGIGTAGAETLCPLARQGDDRVATRTRMALQVVVRPRPATQCHAVRTSVGGATVDACKSQSALFLPQHETVALPCPPALPSQPPLPIEALIGKEVEQSRPSRVIPVEAHLRAPLTP